MNTCLFVSRHTPSDEQVKIAYLLGYNLLTVGDCNAFDQDGVKMLIKKHLDSKTTAVCCVHPLVAVEALRLGLSLVVFENANRAGVGEKPDFRCCGVTVIRGEELEYYKYSGEWSLMISSAH